MLRGRYGAGKMILAWFLLVIALTAVTVAGMKLSAFLFGGSADFM